MQQQALSQLQAGLVDELESKGTFQDPETQKIMDKYQKVRLYYQVLESKILLNYFHTNPLNFLIFKTTILPFDYAIFCALNLSWFCLFCQDTKNLEDNLKLQKQKQEQVSDFCVVRLKLQ